MRRHWQKKYADLEDVNAGLRKKIAELEDALKLCGEEKSKLKGDLALCEGRYKELERNMNANASATTNLSGGADGDASLIADLKARIAELEASINVSNDAKAKLQADLDACESKYSALEGGMNVDMNAGANLANSLTTDAGDMSSGISADSSAGTVDKFAAVKEDNLQIIEGIGPKMESILHENGIRNWSVLASKSQGELKAILDKYGDRYRIIDPSDWSAQAALASDRNWDGLIAYQKDDGSESKAEKVFIKMGILKAYKLNDLKVVEGIGPKIEELLNNAGINTWVELANTSVDRIQSILDDAGSRYSLADPSTWPKQADYAAKGEWDKLEEYQDFLDGGRNPS